MDWDEFPVILGQGSLHDLRDADRTTSPRLLGMKSVSRAGAWGLHREPKPPAQRKVGFAHRRPR